MRCLLLYTKWFAISLQDSLCFFHFSHRIMLMILVIRFFVSVKHCHHHHHTKQRQWARVLLAKIWKKREEEKLQKFFYPFITMYCTMFLQSQHRYFSYLLFVVYNIPELCLKPKSSSFSRHHHNREHHRSERAWCSDPSHNATMLTAIIIIISVCFFA